MNLYVTYTDDEPMALTRTRKASPAEALQYALRCETCGGLGYFSDLDDEKYGNPCPDCVDGIPRWATETVGVKLAVELGHTLASVEPLKLGPNTERIAGAVLKSLRDREE